MSERSFDGLVKVTELAPQGMVTLRGDFSAEGFRVAVKEITGLDVPGQRGAVFEGGKGLLWMSPDELMVLLPQADASDVEAKLNAALEGAHMLAVDVSDARANYALSGDAVRDVIAKIAPVDMGAFGPGEVRRTRFGQVAAALWMEDETTVHLFCFRSVADYMFELLKVAADTAAPVHYYQA